MEIDKDKKVWLLRDSRPYGPFPIHLLGQDHAVLRVPKDKRYWVDAERVPDSGFTKLAVAPLSCLTHDSEAAAAWRERNEPRVGDLVSVLSSRMDPPRDGWPGRINVDVTVEGVVGAVTRHHIQLFSVGDAGVDNYQDFLATPRVLRRYRGWSGGALTNRVTKDSCVIIERGDSATPGKGG